MIVQNVRQNILMLAEAFDAWRVIPRLLLFAYGYLVFNLYIWYKNVPTYVQEKCDGAIINSLMAQGKSMAEIKQFACTVVDVVGGPTTAQSTFVTTIIGLSTGIFGLYTTTGRKWDGWSPDFPNKNTKTAAVVSYEPSAVMTEDGKVIQVGPNTRDDRRRPAVEIYATDKPEGGASEPSGEIVLPDVEPAPEANAKSPPP